MLASGKGEQRGNGMKPNAIKASSSKQLNLALLYTGGETQPPLPSSSRAAPPLEKKGRGAGLPRETLQFGLIDVLFSV
jgi:hypothetical protein